MSGSPTHYVPFGRTAVAVQPSNASQLLMDSDAAGDTNTAYIETIRTGGLMKSASVAMTGTTAVNIGNSDVIEVTDLYLSAVAVGTVTLVEDVSGGTVLATIPIGAFRPRYYGFYLWPTPTSAIDYLIDYRREVVELVNDTDEPPLPTDYHYVLSAYARMKYYEKTDDTRYGIAKGAFDQALSRLKYATQTGADELPVMGRRRVTGYSRLGGQYPADTWS